jgi:hypothetical protein
MGSLSVLLMFLCAELWVGLFVGRFCAFPCCLFDRACVRTFHDAQVAGHWFGRMLLQGDWVLTQPHCSRHIIVVQLQRK